MSDNILTHRGLENIHDIEATLVAEVDEIPDGVLKPPSYPPTAADWKLYRSTFKKLYWTEDRTLKETAELMKERYGFRATKRMYGQRITEWGLKKNYSAGERQAIAQQVAEYESKSQTRPVISIRGRPVKLARIKREDRLGLEFTDLRKRASVGTSRPARSLQMPASLKWVEIIVSQANIFYDVNVETRISRNMLLTMEVEVQETDPTYIRPDDFINKLATGAQEIVQADGKLGWRLLNEALELLKPLFLTRSTYMISALLDIAQQWPQETPPEVSRAVWRHIADMAQVVLGKNEPTAKICNALTHLESTEQIYEATQNTLRLVLSKFEKSLGRDAPPATYIKAKYTRLLLEHGDLDQAERLQREVIQQRMRLQGDGQSVTLAIWRLGRTLKQKNDLQGAEREFLDAWRRSRIDRDPHDLENNNTGMVNVSIAVMIARDMIDLYKETGREDHHVSQLLLEEALDRVTKHCDAFGNWIQCSDLLAVTTLPNLADALKQQGKVAEVEVLRLKYAEYMAE
ncbi:Clr5 domain-containing protein [Bisporella sp. PMI_857]|nr:Clr5 domain-containing protein [Bisporella sp. PMI_857]